jgi:hypothetical protein
MAGRVGLVRHNSCGSACAKYKRACNASLLDLSVPGFAEGYTDNLLKNPSICAGKQALN